MSITLRKLQFFLASATAILLVSLAPNALLADPFIEHNFNQFMQSGAPSGPSYAQLRQEFFGKIEKARAAVAACGGCADAQAELDALLNEERQFQSMASRALAMTGQPPAAFRFLGIQPPSFLDYGASFPSLYESGEALVDTNPDWLNDAPEFCQAPVREHLRTLRSYQDRVQSVKFDFVDGPGGEFYEESRIFRACHRKDYAEFERLAELRKARASGRIIAEFEPIGMFDRREKGTIYYGDVPEDFVPPKMPVDVVRQSLGEAGYRHISIFANKKTDGNLIEVIFSPHSGVFLESKSRDGCRLQYAERPERARRHCDDLNEIHRFEPYVLQCGYRETDRWGRMSRRYVYFWYDERVELAKTDYLLRRDHQHPLLILGDPRTNCPATFEQAWGELEAYQASLVKQRGRIAEIPMSRALPRSEWMRQRIVASRIAAEKLRERMKVTDAYALPGYYTLDYEPVLNTDERTTGRQTPTRSAPPGRPGVPTIVFGEQPVSADCIVAADPWSPGPIFPTACWTESEVSVGKTRQINGVQLQAGITPINRFLLDEDEANTLKSERNGARMTLRRKRDLVQMSEYPLEGDYLLNLAFGGEYLRALCSFDDPDKGASYFRLNCIDGQGRNLQSGLVPTSTHPTAHMVPINNLIHYPSWQSKYVAQGRIVTLGGYDVSKLFAMVDPAFEGDSPRDARLLVFGTGGITGSLRRIERNESTFGDADPVNVTGHWVGDFQCRQTRDMKAELYLQDEGNGRLRDVSGTFVFQDTLLREERVLSHAVAGQYLSDVGALRLEPGEWIKSIPQVGYASLALRATAFFSNAGDADGSARIQGDLLSKTCADLQLTRVSRVVPENIVFDAEPEVVPEVAADVEKTDTPAPATVTASIAQPASAGGSGPVIELAADSFPTGVTVPITVRNLPGNSQDWIAISRAGQADNQYVSYRYLGGATEGTWSLKSGPPGDYEVRVYLNWPTGGYNPVLRRPIKVVSPEEAADAGLIKKPEIHLASRTFAAGQPIKVSVTGFPGNSQDWVAVAKVGSADNTYQDYDYTGGVNEGTWTYTMNEPGEYEIRIYLNWPTGGYNPVLREKISVEAPR